MRRFALTMGILMAAALPTEILAQEVSLTVGRFLGDDLVDAGAGPGDLLPTSFRDAGLYGVRVGVGFLLVDLEASGLIGSTAILDDTPFEVDARFRYLEGSVLLRLLPGPVAPFLAAGVGFHRLSLDLPGVDSYQTIGYNAGAGIKVTLGGFGVRADVRDHITPVDLDEIAPALGEVLGLDADRTLHNFEVSLGLVLSF